MLQQKLCFDFVTEDVRIHTDQKKQLGMSHDMPNCQLIHKKPINKKRNYGFLGESSYSHFASYFFFQKNQYFLHTILTFHNFLTIFSVWDCCGDKNQQIHVI